MGFFDKLKQGLTKTKESINDKINNVFSNFRKVDEELLEELEEALIMSDMGVETSTQIISNLREKIKKEKIGESEQVKEALREEIEKILEKCDNSLNKAISNTCYRSKWSWKNNINRKNGSKISKRWKKSNSCCC